MEDTLIPIGEKTKDYLGKRYKDGSGQLNIGDKVIVSPAVKEGVITSISKEPYEAEVIFLTVKWNGDYHKVREVGTYVKGKHEAVMNDYLFNRLSKIS